MASKRKENDFENESLSKKEKTISFSSTEFLKNKITIGDKSA